MFIDHSNVLTQSKPKYLVDFSPPPYFVNITIPIVRLINPTIISIPNFNH